MHLNWQQHRRKKSVTYWIGDFFRQSEYSLAVIGKNLSLFQRFLDWKQFNFIPVPIVLRCYLSYLIKIFVRYIYNASKNNRHTKPYVEYWDWDKRPNIHDGQRRKEGVSLTCTTIDLKMFARVTKDRQMQSLNLYTWTCHWFILTHASFSGSRLTPLS